MWLKELFNTKSEYKFKVGDWVNSYNKGIHRIEKIIDEYFDESSNEANKIGQIAPNKTIVSKRLLNSKYNKSISYDSCSDFFVSKIDDNQKTELKKFIIENPNAILELNNYQIPENQEIYNSQLQIDNEKDLKLILEIVDFVESGKSYIEILNEIKRLKLEHLKPERFGNYYFQLINYNNEYKNKKKIWRKATLTKIEK
jgi:hypothetical protein